jgi:predicted TIM-barrel fold metal-dependent hydrolase
VIVDVHTHTPTQREPVPPDQLVVSTIRRPDRPVVETVSWADYERDMAAVDVSLVFNLAVDSPAEDVGIPGDPVGINDATAAFVAAAPSRRIGLLSVNPETPGAFEELERCVEDLGLVGLKLGPNYQNFDPLGPAARRLYEIAERRHLPIVFHQGTSPIRRAPLRYAHPLLMDEIAIAFPDLPVVMAHLGHPWQADTLVVIRKHPNVWADVSAGFYRPWSFWQNLRLAAEWDVMAKLLLGSDWPVTTPAETIAGLRSVNDIVAGTRLPIVPPDAIEAIVDRDALAALGLDPPRADGP